MMTQNYIFSSDWLFRRRCNRGKDTIRGTTNFIHWYHHKHKCCPFRHHNFKIIIDSSDRRQLPASSSLKRTKTTAKQQKVKPYSPIYSFFPVPPMICFPQYHVKHAFFSQGYCHLFLSSRATQIAILLLLLLLLLLPLSPEAIRRRRSRWWGLGDRKKKEIRQFYEFAERFILNFHAQYKFRIAFSNVSATKKLITCRRNALMRSKETAFTNKSPL